MKPHCIDRSSYVSVTLCNRRTKCTVVEDISSTVQLTILVLFIFEHTVLIGHVSFFVWTTSKRKEGGCPVVRGFASPTSLVLMVKPPSKIIL